MILWNGRDELAKCCPEKQSCVKGGLETMTNKMLEKCQILVQDQGNS